MLAISGASSNFASLLFLVIEIWLCAVEADAIFIDASFGCFMALITLQIVFRDAYFAYLVIVLGTGIS